MTIETGHPVLMTLDALEVGYQKRALFPALSLSIRPGELWALIGPNGAGKTTLMKTLLGLLPPVSGGFEVSSEARVGYVPQRSAFDPAVPARVVDVVRGGLEQGWSFLNPLHRFKHRETVAQALADTQTAALATQQFSTLSEGQKQRVLMARAVACEPRLLALDEPTSAMDMGAERRVFELVDGLRKRRNLGVFVVSHHLSVLGEHATHAVLVDRGVAVCGTMAEVADSELSRARFGLTLIEAARRGGGQADG